MAKQAKRAKKVVWKEENPRPPAKRTQLTEASKRKAKAAAKRAGRTYPNLVDNMRAAREQRQKRK